jgi:CheY-like chemotaxis protein
MKKLKHVLIVDDNADLRELFTDAIRSHGYSVSAAENGHEALISLRENPAPTLVFLDLMMPKMTGWDFLRVFESKEFAAHSVVTTSAVNMELSTDGRILPATAGRLLKPVTLTNLIAMVEKFCGPPPVHASASIGNA